MSKPAKRVMAKPRNTTIGSKNNASAASQTQTMLPKLTVDSMMPSSIKFAKQFHDVITQTSSSAYVDGKLAGIASCVDFTSWQQRLDQILTDNRCADKEHDLTLLLQSKWPVLYQQVSLDSRAGVPDDWLYFYAIHPFFLPDAEFGHLVVLEFWKSLLFIRDCRARLILKEWIPEDKAMMDEEEIQRLKKRAYEYAEEKTTKLLKATSRANLQLELSHAQEDHAEAFGSTANTDYVGIEWPSLHNCLVLSGDATVLRELPSVFWSQYCLANIHYLATQHRDLVNGRVRRKRGPLYALCKPPSFDDIFNINAPDLMTVYAQLDLAKDTEPQEEVKSAARSNQGTVGDNEPDADLPRKQHKSCRYGSNSFQVAQGILDTVINRLTAWDMDDEGKIVYVHSVQDVEEFATKTYQSLLDQSKKDAHAATLAYFNTHAEKFEHALNAHLKAHPVSRLNSTSKESQFAKSNALAAAELLPKLPKLDQLRPKDIWAPQRLSGWLNSIAGECIYVAMTRALYPAVRFGNKDTASASAEYAGCIQEYAKFAGSNVNDRKTIANFVAYKKNTLYNNMLDLMKKKIESEVGLFRTICERKYQTLLGMMQPWFDRYNEIISAINAEQQQEAINVQLSKDILEKSTDLLIDFCLQEDVYITDDMFQKLVILKHVIVKELKADFTLFDKFLLDEKHTYLDQKAMQLTPELKAIQIACAVNQDKKSADPVHSWLNSHASASTLNQICVGLSNSLVPIRKDSEIGSMSSATVLPSNRPMQIREYVIYLLAHLAHVRILPDDSATTSSKPV
jgi:hypothetical protein